MCTSLEFNELFGSSFDVPCFVFSSFVVQFSRYRLLPLFATAYLVYHTQFRLSRGFLNFFKFLFDIFVRSKSQFLAPSRFLPVSLASRAPAPLRSFIILPLSSPFVNPFFIFFSPFSSFFTLSFRRFELFIPFSSVGGAKLASAPSQNFSRWFVRWICQDMNSKKSFAYIISCPPTTLPAIRYSQPVSVYVKSRGLGKTNQICFSYASLIGET